VPPAASRLGGICIAAIALLGCGAGPDETGLSPGVHRPHALPLNNPSFVPARLADFMQPDDLVIAVVLPGETRAYPWWLARNYHVINDTVEVAREPRAGDDFWEPYIQRPSQPYYEHALALLVTVCEVCGGAAAYLPIVPGQPDRALVFAQCRSDGSPAGNYTAIGTFTMCDSQTHSRWHPFTGKAGSGPLAGQRLVRIPVHVEPWARWLAGHPESRVAVAAPEMRRRLHVRVRGPEIPGSEGAFGNYAQWLASHPEMRDGRLADHALVLGVASGDGRASRVYPLQALQSLDPLIQDRIGDEPYALLRQGPSRAIVFSRRTRDGATLDFTVLQEAPLTLRDGEGNTWSADGLALSGPRRGNWLRALPDSYIAEWSDWIMAHPGSEIRRTGTP